LRAAVGRNGWDLALSNLLKLKTKADLRLHDYISQKADQFDMHNMSAPQLKQLLEMLLPSCGGGHGDVSRSGGSGWDARERLNGLKAALPLARAPGTVGIQHAGSDGRGREVGCLWGCRAEVGAGSEEELCASPWAGVDAAGLYLAALYQLDILVEATPPEYQARALRLGSLLLQLARVCVWTAVADVGEGDVSRSSLVAWREAYAIVVKGETDPSTAAHVLDLAASLHLHRIVAVCCPSSQCPRATLWARAASAIHRRTGGG
jgi:hypothetical protein